MGSRTALRYLGTQSGQFDKYDVSQTRLRVVCYRDCSETGFIIERDGFMFCRESLGCKGLHLRYL